MMVWRRERNFFRFFFPSCIFLSPFSFPPRKIQGTKKMKEEGVKKRVGKKKKKEKKFSSSKERILRCDVCVCVRAFSSSGAFRIDRLSSSIVSRREKGTEEKEEGETRGQS